MKKVILIFAAMVASATMFAQQKGDMYIQGNLGLGLTSSVNNLSTSAKAGSEKHTGLTSDANNLFNFGIAPKFGYFVADNLEVNVALKYNLGLNGNSGYEKVDDEKTDGTPSNATVHTFMVTPGVSYYLPLISGKLYYTPAFGVGFGMMATASKVGSTTESGDPVFAFGFNLDLAAFEYRFNSKMALTANFAGFEYLLGTKTETNSTTVAGTEIKASATANANAISFGLGNVTVGFKYYF
ncbi:MAG: hypothetical protein ACI3ZQ_07815 [Candidatus Cryptobacteroides sp.]